MNAGGSAVSQAFAANPERMDELLATLSAVAAVLANSASEHAGAFQAALAGCQALRPAGRHHAHVEQVERVRLQAAQELAARDAEHARQLARAQQQLAALQVAAAVASAAAATASTSASVRAAAENDLAQARPPRCLFRPSAYCGDPRGQQLEIELRVVTHPTCQ